MTDVAFAVRLEAALRVKPFVSKEETRYYLAGISIDAGPDGGAVCAATDGHRLGARFDPEGIAREPVIVKLPPEIKMKAGMLASPWLIGVRTAPGKGYIAVVEAATKSGDEDTAEAAIERLEDCTIRIGHAFIDGQFPDWRRVVPAPTGEDTVRTFNGDYIKSFGAHMTMRGSDESAPHLIRVASDPLFVGVLMSICKDARTGGDKLPDWLAAPATPIAKAA